MKPLPCPFCGADDTGVTKAFGEYLVLCNDCLAGGPITERKQAVALWNAVAEVLDTVKVQTGLGG